MLWDPNQKIFNNELMNALAKGDSSSVESILLNDPTVQGWITNYDLQTEDKKLIYGKKEDGRSLVLRLIKQIAPSVFKQHQERWVIRNANNGTFFNSNQQGSTEPLQVSKPNSVTVTGNTDNHNPGPGQVSV
jgi:hypothetical protein